MGKLVSYQRPEGVSTITMDDGKVNAMSAAMMQEINAALDQAEEHRSVVILTGRDGVFSDQLLDTARETAAALSKLDMTAHAATKLRVRGTMLEALEEAITSELAS
jgi:enoyl-CoA hydratase